MALKLTANIKQYGTAGYIAWFDSIKGMVVQGGTPGEVITELLISLKVKMAYDLGIEINDIGEKSFSSEEEMNNWEKEIENALNAGKKEIKLNLTA